MSISQSLQGICYDIDNVSRVKHSSLDGKRRDIIKEGFQLAFQDIRVDALDSTNTIGILRGDGGER